MYPPRPVNPSGPLEIGGFSLLTRQPLGIIGRNECRSQKQRAFWGCFCETSRQGASGEPSGFARRESLTFNKPPRPGEFSLVPHLSFPEDADDGANGRSGLRLPEAVHRDVARVKHDSGSN